MAKKIDTNGLWIESEIIEFVNNSIENSLGGNINERAWESPLVGFSKGDDELYYKLKEDIGEFLWTPQEIFLKAYPNLKVQPNELSVVSWILPQAEKTKLEQRLDSTNPSERAVLARTNGENFNKKIGKFIVDLLEMEGIKAVAPGQSSFWENRNSEKYGFASTWSERHAAYISGLGTFSLTDALITPLGTAVRIGSVVINAIIEPTKRNYTKYNEYCLFSSKGSCMICAKRCPANAIDENGMIKLNAECIKEVLRPSILKKNTILTLTTVVFVYLEHLVSQEYQNRSYKHMYILKIEELNVNVSGELVRFYECKRGE